MPPPIPHPLVYCSKFSAGMRPPNALSFNTSEFTLLIFLIVAGIVPEILLCWSQSCVTLIMLPTVSGSVPDIPLLCRYSGPAIRRFGASPSQFTPHGTRSVASSAVVAGGNAAPEHSHGVSRFAEQRSQFLPSVAS